eukprot:COSAG06_NODE_1772_length_8428_cov_8.827710_5_plen_59_part_00
MCTYMIYIIYMMYMCTYMMIASRCIIGYHVFEFFSKFQLKNGHLSRQALDERKEEPGE